VMIDTLQTFLTLARHSNTLKELGLADPSAGGPRTRYAVVTLHRPSTVDNPRVLRRIWEALQDISKGVRIIFPAHPRTQSRLREAGLNNSPGTNRTGAATGLQIIPPLGYLQFLHLQSESVLVITDSGGIQEETTVLGIPCLTVRENTERPITVSEGTNTLVGLNPMMLRRAAEKILSGRSKAGRIPRLWDGHAAERIVNILCERLRGRTRARKGPRTEAVAS